MKHGRFGKRGGLAVAAGLAVILAMGGPAAAQTRPAAAGVAGTAPAPVTAARPAPVREAYANQLITLRERFEMWRQSLHARTHEDRVRLWAANRALIEARAAEHGVILRQHGSMILIRPDRPLRPQPPAGR